MSPFLIFLLFMYFVPTGLCKPRKRKAVFVINLFLGWTIIGWVVALAMAVWPEPGKEGAL